jgi:hypothetical protein
MVTYIHTYIHYIHYILPVIAIIAIIAIGHCHCHLRHYYCMYCYCTYIHTLLRHTYILHTYIIYYGHWILHIIIATHVITYIAIAIAVDIIAIGHYIHCHTLPLACHILPLPLRQAITPHTQVIGHYAGHWPYMVAIQYTLLLRHGLEAWSNENLPKTPPITFRSDEPG